MSAFDRFGQLCVGVDPHPYLLDAWGLPDNASGLERFGRRVVEAAADRVGIIKPQVAFFERHGSAGYVVLEAIIRAARQAGLMVIADAKRGDLGTSVEAYGMAWFTPGSPLEVDAITMNAYMGLGSIEAPMALAQQNGAGLFVLAATSNPEAFTVQTARISSGLYVGQTVASSIVAGVDQWNYARASDSSTRSSTADSDSSEIGSSGVGAIGLVLGATVDFEKYGIDRSALGMVPACPVLAPGFGHQGARFGDLDRIYGPAAPFTVVSASRSILEAGPVGIDEAIIRQAAEVFACRA